METPTFILPRKRGRKEEGGIGRKERQRLKID